MAFPPDVYLYQQRFPDVKVSSRSANDCLIKVQSRTPLVNRCIISNQSTTLKPGNDFTLHFDMVPSPIASHFELELGLAPPPNKEKATPQQQQHAKDNRMIATFSTFDADGPRFGDRQPYEYTSNFNNTPPAGPLSFSQQLYDVTFCTADKMPKGFPLLDDAEPQKQLVFCWKAKRCTKIAFSLPLDKLKPDAQSAAAKFKNIIESASSGEELYVVTNNQPLIASVFWPWFAAIPAPVPESYWPWIFPFDSKDPLQTMRFPPNKPFERLKDYVDKAIAARPKGWTQTQDATKLPEPLTYANFDGPVVHFTDFRQYLAIVLGSHGYEELHGKSNLDRWFNGRHTCDIWPGTWVGSRDVMILLNLRPPLETDVAKVSDSSSLPGVGERVDIHAFFDKDREVDLTGEVIRIPSKYAKYARNIAIRATMPPTASGYVVTVQSRVKADFHFGHYGSPVSPLRERIIEVMTGSDAKPIATFLKNLLLAQDNHSLSTRNTTRVDNLPKDFKDTVMKVCTKRNLNPLQIEAVKHHFTNFITIVCGPPGTGKSTLIDTILELEEIFKQRYWVCTESNAAVNVLAQKLCVRKGTMQPAGFLRIKPAAAETLSVKVTSTGPEPMALPDLPARQGEETPAQAIARFLNSPSVIEACMSLEALIKDRVAKIAKIGSGEVASIYGDEHDDLVTLAHAYRTLYGLKEEKDQSPEDLIQEQKRLERKYINQLRLVQARYTARAMGVFSTAAAASGPFLRNHFNAQSVIMDEASQFLEARAVHPLLHAAGKGSLTRVILIGDEKQLPPTIMAPKNPFASSAEVSLFERLIMSGAQPIRLVEQFRMHPSISSVVNTTMYNGTLKNGANTTARPAVSQFQKWAVDFAKRSKMPQFNPSNAIIVSPVRCKEIPWGSQKAKGSTSRYNPLNARMVLALAYELIVKGGFKAKDIMVICFYSDQKAFLEALFADFNNLKGIAFDTVDGSQGSEAPVVIVDCVVYGQEEGKGGMGFLGQERRRFNVAMSRAQSGRIVIARRNMITDNKGADLNAGPWKDLILEARKANTIIDGALLNLPLASEDLEKRFKDVQSTYTKATTNMSVEREKPGTTAVVLRSTRKHNYEVTTFMNATGGTVEEAEEYLKKAKNDLAVAINAFFSKHGSDMIAEDI